MPVGLKPARGLDFIVLFMAAWPAPAQPIADLVQRALANNREYLASLQRVGEAEALLRQAGIRPAPSLEAEGGSTRLLGAPGSQEYSVAYSHPLETGGKRAKRIAVATLGLAIVRAEAGEKRRMLTLEVRRDYAEALKAGRRAAVLADIARIDGETLRLVSVRVDEGDAAPLERQLLETEIARNEAERALAEGRAETSLLALQRIGALPPGAALNPEAEGTREAPPSAGLAQRALDSRPDLRALRLAEEQARASLDLVRAESSPDLTASARYSYRNTAFDQFGFDSAGGLTPVRDRENVLTFGFSAPLFTGRRNQANVEAALAREREARLRREHLAAAIPAEVNLAVRNWEAARKALAIYSSRILPQAERNLNVIRQAWQLGESRFLDVLNERRRFAELRLAQVDAEADLMAAWAEVEHAVGGDIQ
jgi:outer membrane protein, heavy metal efflux system